MTLLAALAGIVLLFWAIFVGLVSRGRHRDEIVSDPVGCFMNGIVLLILIGIIWRSLI